MFSWRITQYNALFDRAIFYLAGTGNECQHLWSELDYRWTATRLGDPLQIKKEIQLFSDPNFNGTPYKVNASMPSIIPHVRVGSLFFSGNHSWRLFSEPNYKGETTCFSPQVQGRDWGITYKYTNNLIVGSVKEGC